MELLLQINFHVLSTAVCKSVIYVVMSQKTDKLDTRLPTIDRTVSITMTYDDLEWLQTLFQQKRQVT